MVKNKINLSTATLININIIIGAGLFLNTATITKYAGAFGFSLYLLAATLLLPIVLVISKLAQKYPIEGGLYAYNKKILGNFWGFLSGWSYFLGKTTSAAFLSHIFTTFFQNKIPILQKIDVLLLDFILIFFLILINILGISIGGKIQYLFSGAKIIPIIFVIFTSLSIFNPKFFIFKENDFYNLFHIIPVAIFALLSFEIITSIGHMITKPEKNIQKAIIYSFLIVVAISTIFHFLIFGALGKKLTSINIPISLLSSKIFKKSIIIPSIINTFLFISILGGVFGTLTSNCWNFYVLSKDNFYPFSKLFIKINKKNVPYVSLLFQGIIAFILLSVSRNQLALQNITVLGIAITYISSSISLFKIFKNVNFKKKLLPIFAILSASYIAIICIKNMVNLGISLPFITIFFIGIALKLIFKKTNSALLN